MRLPDDLNNFRANKPLMQRVVVALSATAAVMLFVTGSRMMILPPESVEPVIDYKRVAASRTSDLVWLMAGRDHRLVWTDQHTGMDKMLICEVHEVGFMVTLR